MQGVLSMLLAILVAMIATVGDIVVVGVGAGGALLALAAVGALAISANYEPRHVWEVIDGAGGDEQDEGFVGGRLVSGLEPGAVKGFEATHAPRRPLRVPSVRGGAGVRHLRASRRAVGAGQHGRPTLMVTLRRYLDNTP